MISQWSAAARGTLLHFFERNMMTKYKFRRCVAVFVADDTGHDLLEYSLLLAFIALFGAAAFLGMSGSTNVLWSVANSRLAAANES